MLSRNLKYLRRRSKLSQEELSEKLGISRTTYAGYENGKSEPVASLLKKISVFFSVALDDLLSVDLGVPLFQQKNKANLETKDLRILAISVDKNQKESIEYIPVSATAGYAIDYVNCEYIESLTRFHLPKHPEGTYRAFEIQGESMLPIQPGSIVIGKYVEHWKELRNGERYILVMKNEGVVFKRVINEVTQNRRLILVSDNNSYLPYTVSINDILEAWELFSFIGFNQRTWDDDNSVQFQLQIIAQKLDQLLTKSYAYEERN